MGTDAFLLRWRDTQRKLMVIMGEFSRYEVESAISKEKVALEIRVLENKWRSWAGPPKALRLDMSGPRMSNELKKWATAQAIAFGFTGAFTWSAPRAVDVAPPVAAKAFPPACAHILQCRSQSPTQYSRFLSRHARHWLQPTKAKRPGRCTIPTWGAHGR